MPLIDAHAHWQDGSKASVEHLRDKDIQVVNIGVGCPDGRVGTRNDNGQWWQRNRNFFELKQDAPDRFHWITSFAVPEGDEAGYQDRWIRQLREDFANGAIACKVWKCYGMQCKKADGSDLLVDDPIFEPIFEMLAAEKKPLLMHIGEPRACWRPLGPDNSYTPYYSKNPQYHMYGKTEWPSHETLMASRDRVIEKHPNLQVIGAHFASLEFDVNEMAQRFRKYPNFAVDTSGIARVVDLGEQDRDTVRRFMIEWQDRIMFGTDFGTQSHKNGDDTPIEQRLEAYESLRNAAVDFYAGAKDVEIKGHRFQGIDLPKAVQEKLFRTNAKKWYELSA